MPRIAASARRSSKRRAAHGGAEGRLQGRLKLGPGATVLDIPQNQAFLREIDSAPDLTPERLLRLAIAYRDNPTTRALADQLAAQAMKMFAQSRSVTKAMRSIARTEVEWSWLGDLWDDIVGFFVGGKKSKDCRYKCAGGSYLPVTALVEKCGDNDKWHIIGVCVFGSF